MFWSPTTLGASTWLRSILPVSYWSNKYHSPPPRAAYSRLKAAAGRVTPHRIARLSDAHLRINGLTRQKAAYCRNLAKCIADDTLILGHFSQLDDPAVRSKLLQVPGIGPWTADIYLLMVLRRPDVWPDGDLALAKAVQQVKRLRSRPSQERLQRIANGWVTLASSGSTHPLALLSFKQMMAVNPPASEV